MPWYAVHTKSRHEHKVRTGLIQKSIETFLPLIEVWSRRKDRKKRISVPMFPGYLFVEVSSMDSGKRVEILKTVGVVKILGVPGDSLPSAVPDVKITAIKRLVDSKVEVMHYQYPRIGEMARILDGPFKDIEGVVVETNYNKNLFVISIDILQRSVAIEVKGFLIERI
jgi:transcription termination/antitermination protein NusG